MLVLGGADLLNGTPVYDVKPYLPFADCVPQATGGFARAVEGEQMNVVYQADVSFLPPQTLSALTSLLQGDPRPHYHADPARVYAFEFWGVHVEFTCENGTLTVTKAAPV